MTATVQMASTTCTAQQAHSLAKSLAESHSRSIEHLLCIALCTVAPAKCCSLQQRMATHSNPSPVKESERDFPLEIPVRCKINMVMQQGACSDSPECMNFLQKVPPCTLWPVPTFKRLATHVHVSLHSAISGSQAGEGCQHLTGASANQTGQAGTG